MFLVKRLTGTAKLPTKSYQAAGYDFYADEDATIPAGGQVKIRLGVACAVPEGHAALYWDRSGMGSKGMHRFAGVIDEDYRGEWAVILHNATIDHFEIKQGDKIIQALIQEVKNFPVQETDELPPSERGSNGWGSTG